MADVLDLVDVQKLRNGVQDLEPTAGFESATRCLQIRIYGVRSVSIRADECRFVFGGQKFRADNYRSVSLGGEPSGGILVVRLPP